MDELSFEQLDQKVSQLSNGDDSARDELIQLSFDRLRSLTRKMIKSYPAVRRWQETDDVFQQAALRLWQSLSEVKPANSRHFFNLAALQVRRELIDLARSYNSPSGINQNRESVAGLDENQRPIQSPDASTETHEGSSLATWTEFHQSVDQLDEDEREVFELIWYQGLSQTNVAQLLDTPQRSISRRWQKARRNLYSLLGKQLPE